MVPVYCRYGLSTATVISAATGTSPHAVTLVNFVCAKLFHRRRGGQPGLQKGYSCSVLFNLISLAAAGRANTERSMGLGAIFPKPTRFCCAINVNVEGRTGYDDLAGGGGRVASRVIGLVLNSRDVQIVRKYLNVTYIL